MKYTTLLFDADDTLFDFRRAESEALRQTLAAFGLPFSPELNAIYAACNQQVWKEFERGKISSPQLRLKRFALFGEKSGTRLDPQQVSPVYLQNLGRSAFLLPGAEELIARLGPRFRLALVTNGIAQVQRARLERSPLANAFDGGVFISEEIGAAKPAPAFFEAVFAALGRPPRAEVLIIGDSLTSDMQGGLNYGIDTCWLNPDPIHPAPRTVTFQIQKLEELLNHLQA